MKKFIQRFGPTIASFALVVSVTASNQVCGFIFGQSELPENVKSLRKF